MNKSTLSSNEENALAILHKYVAQYEKEVKRAKTKWDFEKILVASATGLTLNVVCSSIVTKQKKATIFDHAALSKIKSALNEAGIEAEVVGNTLQF